MTILLRNKENNSYKDIGAHANYRDVRIAKQGTHKWLLKKKAIINERIEDHENIHDNRQYEYHPPLNQLVFPHRKGKKKRNLGRDSMHTEKVRSQDYQICAEK